MQRLDKESVIEDSLEIASAFKCSSLDIDPILKSLLAEDYIALTVIERKAIELTDEGKIYQNLGTPEYQYAAALEMGKPLTKTEVAEKIGKDVANIGFAQAMKKKWIKLDKATNSVERISENLEDGDKALLDKFL